MATRAARESLKVTVTLGVPAITFVALRFYCRLKIQKIPLGGDDWCILVALLLSTAIAIVADFAAVNAGVGDGSFTPTLDQIVFALKTVLALEITQITCMGLVKISLLLYYKRILVWNLFQTIINVLIGIVALFNAAIIMLILFSKGTPISKQWDPSVRYTATLQPSATLVYFCVGNMTLDVVTLMLPITVVRSLHMSANKKLLLSVTFSLGSLCIVASIMRLYYAVEYVREKSISHSYFEKQFSHDMIWALVESPAFIIAGCLITLGPLFRSKYGPANLLRSLRSVIFPNTGLNTSSKGRGSSRTNESDETATISKLRNERPSSTDTIVDKIEDRLTWELRELDETGSDRRQRNTQSLV
ncbi:hypothetical protein BDV96DRAFT_642973 [Lophiotrema nucula]|uniref:Rhodopsin domain-containing protein n=1 Tax=Lophiotrema nucula TaxID=690887 RepID=A0A6A5ZGZ4_9PLEO|nr:hypothetical protein BDV96DRAFT_642973 [Lophiotrema nucula]